MEFLFALVLAFFTDPRTLGALLLIAVDLLTGIASAVVRGVFQWAHVQDVLFDEIVPFVEGYLAFYLLSYAGVQPFFAQYLGAEAAQWIAVILTTAAAGFSYLPILTSIGRNYLEIKTGRRKPAPVADTPTGL
ncbi:hypothetical protein SE17_00175 [Kouleothrix aurantiaca]|uniref:Uncharacterized protein n=1 Tax=Kouleothrix aurantiaca TaxID=186479 RepID=A0A0P9D7R3_9CHLR|nr:hypothetical protein SE17_00175 [Kouleothrix aurantiaca]